MTVGRGWLIDDGRAVVIVVGSDCAVIVLVLFLKPPRSSRSSATIADI